MSPTLYMIEASPPVRSVLLTAKALGLHLNLKEVNVLEGEHLKPEYLKLNPQHTVPTLVDEDGFVIWDSHAINAYLVGKYGKDDSFYPKDLQKRAIVDQRLHFDTGTLFARLISQTRPIIFHGQKQVSNEANKSIKEAYSFLEAFLKGHQYVTGDSLTIADFSIVTTLTSSDVLVPISQSEFPNITAWLKRMQSLPCYEANKKGLNDFANLIKSKLG